MTRYTLEEAALVLESQLGAEHKIAGRFTAAQVLRAGSDGRLLITVPLDLRCYSPTAFARGASHEEASQSEAFGWFVVPPRHLFALEVADQVKLQMVTSLDGRDIFFPFVSIGAASLRVMEPHLQAFAESLRAGEDRIAEQPGLAPLQSRQQAQESAIKRWLRDSGHDLLALPAPPIGKPGIKARARAAMLQSPKLFTPSSFEKAWERLSQAREIAYQS